MIYQKRNENIMAVKEVSEKELKRLKHKNDNRDKEGLTSQHHMAAEATIRKIKAFLKVQKKGRPDYVPTESVKIGGSSVKRGSFWKGGEIEDVDVNSINGRLNVKENDRPGVFLRTFTARKQQNRNNFNTNHTRKDKS